VSLKDAIHGVQKEFVLPTGKKLSVKIPPGVTNGTKLRFPDQVYFEVQLKEPPGFRIEGDDLVSELSVFVPEALVGGDVRAETIDGPVLVHVPAGVDSDRRIRLAGRGLYNRSTNVRGAQIFIVKLRMPKFVPPELVAAAKKKAAAA
jgi:curved DNA-binding protein